MNTLQDKIGFQNYLDAILLEALKNKKLKKNDLLIYQDEFLESATQAIFKKGEIKVGCTIIPNEQVMEVVKHLIW